MHRCEPRGPSGAAHGPLVLGGSHAVHAETDPLPSLEAERIVAEADRKPLREQLRRRHAPPERDHRAARVARFREGTGPRRERPEARGAGGAQFHAPPRALLREPRRRGRSHGCHARGAGARFRLLRALEGGVRRHGLRTRRRLGMGRPRVHPARCAPREPVRFRALAGALGRRAHPRARHVRACVSHRLRRQREGLCGYVLPQYRLAGPDRALRAGRAGRPAEARGAARIRRPSEDGRRGSEGAARRRRRPPAGDRRSPAPLRVAPAGYRRRRHVARPRAHPGMDRRAFQGRAGRGVLRVRLPRGLQYGDEASRSGVRREVHGQRALRMEGDRGAGANGEDVSYSLGSLLLYMLKLGSLGFGGPAALCGAMHRDLVERRRWISEGDYKEGLALAQLMPGPLAAQLAMYLGYVHYRIPGATLVGFAFVIPSFLMVVALGWAYVRFGGLAWMQAVFYGVGAAVIGIIAMSAFRLTTKSVGRDKLLWAIYLFVAEVTAATENEMAWLFIAGGLLVWMLRAPPPWLTRGGAQGLFAAQAATGASIASSLEWPLLAQIAVFFAEAGAFVFGSGLAIVPFLYGGVVTEHHWLTERQFVDAVAVAMITPGPVVITVGFVGYL